MSCRELKLKHADLEQQYLELATATTTVLQLSARILAACEGALEHPEMSGELVEHARELHDQATAIAECRGVTA